MGYADSLLTDGEYIVYRTREHPLARLIASRWGIALAGIGLAGLVILLLFGIGPGVARDLLGWAVLVCLVAGGVLIGWTYVGWYNEDYLVTNRRVIKLSGILNKRAADSSLEKINDAILEQSIFGRMFDWGDLRILTASELADVDYQMLHHALEFKKVMLMTKHDVETGIDRRMDGRRDQVTSPADAPPSPAAPAVAPAAPAEPEAAPAAPAPAPAAPAPPAPATAAPPTADEKLRTLAKLRDDGIITPEDYEAKKAQILEQL
jgi:hypothetical protein